MAPPKPKYKAVFVAIHGIGKQSRNATVRTVVSMTAQLRAQASQRLSVHYPLGYFYSDLVDVTKISPFDDMLGSSDLLKDVAFSEVFWADIPQDVVKESRTMEETKQWARTVIARARNSYHAYAKNEDESGLIPPNFHLAAETLEEIIDTISVLENLSWIVEKAGIMSFDVSEVVEEYLGDVQIVTEFSQFRNQIIGRFHKVMADINTTYPDADIHIVAHSEGTVITLLALLHAMAKSSISSSSGTVSEKKLENTPAWLKRVRGLMTIGSPIDKHILLWPSLWEGFDFSNSKGGWEKAQIKWRNYYDYGDPIGFNLDTARQWISQKNANIFEFKDSDDYGFSRYILPGKAHNDYWEDVDVFSHFISEVVLGGSKVKPVKPTNRGGVGFVSTALPYVFSLSLFFLASYILIRAAIGYFSPEMDSIGKYIYFMMNGSMAPEPKFNGVDMLLQSLGATGLLAGTCIAARLQRLAPEKRSWCRISLLLAFGSTLLISGKILDALVGNWLFPKISKIDTGSVLCSEQNWVRLSLCLICAIGVYVVGLIGRTKGRDCLNEEIGLGAVRKGARPLIICLTLISLMLALAAHLVENKIHHEAKDALERDYSQNTKTKENTLRAATMLTSSPPLWPAVLSLASFIYLSWLAVSVFDLAFIWHRYIRNGKAQEMLRIWRQWKPKVEG
jgi:hypothetical protein